MRKLCTLELTANSKQYTSSADTITPVMAGSWWDVNTGVPSSITARKVGASTSNAFHNSSTYLAAAAATAAGAEERGWGEEAGKQGGQETETGALRRSNKRLSSHTHLFAGLCFSGCSTSWGVQLCTWPYRMMNP